MNVPQPTPVPGPPKFIPALVSGFNLVASKVYLLALPIALDLFLWFGPHFRLKTLLYPTIQEIFSNQPNAGTDATAMFATMTQLWGMILDHFNLLTLLSALPVGVPSLMAGILPNQNPLGLPPAFEIASWNQALSGWLLFAILGLVLGCFYFSLVSRATAHTAEPFSFAHAVWEVMQVFGMTLMLLALMFVFSIPIMIISVVLGMINPGIAQVAVLVCSFLLLWVLLPLVFTPHGIYVNHQNAFRSMLISGSLVRSMFPGVALFLLSAIILAQGLGYLWRLPPENSWFMLAGIFGNAFIGTGLLAASFIYYRSAAAWTARLRKESILNSRVKL
jgi:hypothetical protein